MALPGVKDRIGGVGNQFALSTILSFLVSIPVMLYKEGDKVDKLIKLCTTDKSFLFNLVASSMCFYLYNELATMTIKKTGAVTASVANTAKRVIVIVGVSIATGEVLSFEKKMGSAIAIGGVLVYSLIDDMLKPKAKSS